MSLRRTSVPILNNVISYPQQVYNDITSIALKSSGARAQKRNKTKSVIIFKSRGHNRSHHQFKGLKCCQSIAIVSSLLLFRPFPYLGSVHRLSSLHVFRYCASSIFTCFAFMYVLTTSLHLRFGVPIFRCLYLLLSFSPHGLTISVTLLLFLHLYLPHLPLLLFLLSSSSQSSLSPSSISTFSSPFFLASFAQPFSVPRSHFHTL